MMMKRRDAFKSMIALAVAPAIVRVEMIMPVKHVRVYTLDELKQYLWNEYPGRDEEIAVDSPFVQEGTFEEILSTSTPEYGIIHMDDIPYRYHFVEGRLKLG